MNRSKIQRGVEKDLRKSPSQRIIYLEGKTDVKFLFGLLGLPTPPGDADEDVFHQGVLVKTCGWGSGSTAVRAHVEVASGFHRPGFVCGIIDGDGLPLERLAANFDAPYAGPLFTWKAYSIENLVAKTGWPSPWGDPPDWQPQLSNYGPYVALNRIGSEARAILKDLGLANYSTPTQGSPLRTPDEVAGALEAGKARLLTFDIEQRYMIELFDFETTVQRSLDEAHALINGKWLFQHMAPTLTARDTSQCEYDWLAQARSVGGLTEVREWWERVTGNSP